MPRCGRPARRAVSRPVCANEKNPALSVDRKLLGTSKRASHPARPVPAAAPQDPPRQAHACRSAIGRPILKRASHPAQQVPAVAPHDPPRSAHACKSAIGRPILKRASHPAQRVPAVAPHDPPRSAHACRSAIGRPIFVPARAKQRMRTLLFLGPRSRPDLYRHVP